MKKTLNRLRKIFLSLLLIFSSLYLGGIQNVSASTFITQDKNSYHIPSQYSFEIKYSSQTTVKLYSPHGTWSGENEKSLTGFTDSDKGKVYALYSNVGRYDGKNIDAKITYTDWNNPKKLIFNIKEIGIGNATQAETGAYNTRWIDVKVEYFVSGTSTPININGHGVIGDLDKFERLDLSNSNISTIIFDSNQTSKYDKVSNNLIGSNVGGTGSADGASFAYLFSGTSTTFRWRGAYLTFGKTHLFDVEPKYNITTSSTNASITGNQYDIVKGTNKTISWSAIDGYYISSVVVDGVSQSISDYRGGSYTFNSISANHTVSVSASPCYVITTQGTNATITGNQVKIDPDSSRTISWSANDGYWLSSVIVDGVSQSIPNYRNGSYTFNNINANHDVKVVANPCYNITTEVVHGNITGNQTKIDPHSNRKIDFSAESGYYVSQVIVDGIAYSYKDYATSYTFSNITSNHHIKVICEPLKNIVTEIENGVITKTMTGVHPDEIRDVIFNSYWDYYIDSVVVDGTNVAVQDFVEGNYEFNTVQTDHYVKVVCLPKPVVYTEITNGDITPQFSVYPHEDGKTVATAHENYYISRVLVNGQEINDFEEYQNTYTFKDITQDQHIYVECVPIPEIVLDKTTDKDTYNYKDTIHYNVNVKQSVENATATNVTVTDVLPSNLKIKENSFVIDGVNEDKYQLETTEKGFKAVFDEIGYNQDVNISYDVEVQDILMVGNSITNNVYATCDHFNNQVHDNITNNVLKPVLNVDKSTDSEKYNVNDIVTYSIDVKQTVENAKAFDVVLTDTNMTSGIDIDYSSIEVLGTDKDNYTISQLDKGFKIIFKELSSEVITVTYNGKITDNSLAGKTISNSATVTSLTSDGVQKVTVTNEVYKPNLVISKTADKDYYNVLDNITFNIALSQSVENAKAFNVVLTDTDISNGIDIDYFSIKVLGTDEDNYTINQLDKGFKIIFKELSNENINVIYSGKINDNSLSGTDIRNSVSATCDNNTDVVTSSVVKPVLKPKLTVSKTQDKDNYNVKDNLVYTINVKQTVENAIANNVVIKDLDLTDGIELDLDTIKVSGIDETLYEIIKKDNSFEVVLKSLAYNQEVIITVNGKVSDNSLAGETIENSVSTSCDNNTSVVKDTVQADVYKPQLEITKKADKDIYNVLDTISYTLNVKQTVKGARANDVVITDTLNSGMTLDMKSFVIDGIDKDDYSVQKTDKGFIVKITSLEDECTITYKAKIEDDELAGTDVINKASVTSSNNTDVVKTEINSKVAKPTLELTKVADKQKYNVGDVVDYTVTLRQTDKNAKAFNVLLKDNVMTKGVELDYSSITVKGLEDDNYSLETFTNGFDLMIKRLDFGMPVEISLKAKITDPQLAEKEIMNIVNANCDNNKEIVNAKAVSEVYKPQLEITKKADKDIYNVLDTITYTLNVKQTVKGAKANDVVITDTLNDGMSLNMKSFVIDGIDEDDYSVQKTDKGFIVKITSLEDECTITYKAKIEDYELAGTDILNKASVTSSNNTDIVKTEINSKVAKPTLELTKTTDKDYYNVHDVIEYKITAKQTQENAIAHDVIIKDFGITDGVKLDLDSIKVTGIEDYSIKKLDNEFIINIPMMKNESIDISVKGTIEDSTLANKEIHNQSSITCSNNTDVVTATSKSKVLMPEFKITKAADKDYYNIEDTIHYTIKAKQTVENAKAFDVVLDDSHINKGVSIDKESIKVTGIDEDDYDIEFKDNGYLLVYLKSMTDEEITIEYDGVLIDESLAGTEIMHEVYISCSNNPYVSSWKDNVTSQVLKPQWELSKIADKKEAYKDDTVHYTIKAKQTIENAKAFDIDIVDELESNQELIENTIKITNVSESDNEYQIITSQNGFTVHFDELIDVQDIVIEYDTKVTDDLKETSVNEVLLSDRYNSISASSELAIKKMPTIVITEDPFVSSVFVTTLVFSFVGFIYLLKEKENQNI